MYYSGSLQFEIKSSGKGLMAVLLIVPGYGTRKMTTSASHLTRPCYPDNQIRCYECAHLSGVCMVIGLGNCMALT